MAFYFKGFGKILPLLLFLGCLMIPSAEISAQQEKVSLSERRITTGKALQEMREQTRYRFAVNRSRFNLEREVILARNEATVEEILHQLLWQTDHTYTVSGRQILITYQEPAPVVEEPVVEEPEVRPEIYGVGTPRFIGKKQEPVVVNPIENRISPPEEKAPGLMLALKTNLLYWAGVMPDFHYYTITPNIEAEVFFADRWSISGSWVYAKWDARKDDFWGISSWTLEPRYWIKGNGSFQGVYLGIYGSIGDFDVQNDRIREYGNTGDFYSAGISAGVLFPLSDSWAVELGLRGGYRHSKIEAYYHEAPDDFYQSSRNENSWEITGLNVSFSYRFGKSRK